MNPFKHKLPGSKTKDLRQQAVQLNRSLGHNPTSAQLQEFQDVLEQLIDAGDIGSRLAMANLYGRRIELALDHGRTDVEAASLETRQEIMEYATLGLLILDAYAKAAGKRIPADVADTVEKYRERFVRYQERARSAQLAAVSATADRSRQSGSNQAAGTVSVPNPWGLGNGDPFTLPARPNMADVFAQVDPKEQYTILHMYLYHPDPDVRLETLVEAKRIHWSLGSYQPLVDALADPVPAVQHAAADLIWTSEPQLEFTLNCLSEEIHQTAGVSTMTGAQAEAALEILTTTAPAGRADMFASQVAEIIGGSQSADEQRP